MIYNWLWSLFAAAAAWSVESSLCQVTRYRSPRVVQSQHSGVLIAPDLLATEWGVLGPPHGEEDTLVIHCGARRLRLRLREDDRLTGVPYDTRRERPQRAVLLKLPEALTTRTPRLAADRSAWLHHRRSARRMYAAGMGDQNTPHVVELDPDFPANGVDYLHTKRWLDSSRPSDRGGAVVATADDGQDILLGVIWARMSSVWAAPGGLLAELRQPNRLSFVRFGPSAVLFEPLNAYDLAPVIDLGCAAALVSE